MRCSLSGHTCHPGNRQGDRQEKSATYPMFVSLAQTGQARKSLF